VALPAFAAERRAATWLLPRAGRAAIDRYLLTAGPTAANPQAAAACGGRMEQAGGAKRRIEPQTLLRVLRKQCSNNN